MKLTGTAPADFYKFLREFTDDSKGIPESRITRLCQDLSAAWKEGHKPGAWAADLLTSASVDSEALPDPKYVQSILGIEPPYRTQREVHGKWSVYQGGGYRTGNFKCEADAFRWIYAMLQADAIARELDVVPVVGSLDDGVPNHTDHMKRGFQPK